MRQQKSMTENGVRETPPYAARCRCRREPGSVWWVHEETNWLCFTEEKGSLKFPAAQRIKGPASSLLWLGFDPQPRNFRIQWASPKTKQNKTTTAKVKRVPGDSGCGAESNCSGSGSCRGRSLLPGPVQWVKGPVIAAAAAQVAAVAGIQSLAWELPYAMRQP